MTDRVRELELNQLKKPDYSGQVLMGFVNHYRPSEAPSKNVNPYAADWRGKIIDFLKLIAVMAALLGLALLFAVLLTFLWGVMP